MIGAFLGVHRGDAEFFKPPAAVRNLSPDTHELSPLDPLHFIFSESFLQKFRTPQRGHTLTRGRYVRVGEFPAVPALSHIRHRHHDE